MNRVKTLLLIFVISSVFQFSARADVLCPSKESFKIPPNEKTAEYSMIINEKYFIAETKCLEAAKGIVIRKDNVLKFTTSNINGNEQSIYFVNNSLACVTDENECLVYVIQAYFDKINVFLIEEIHNSGVEVDLYTLLDGNNGNKIQIGGFPVFSDNKNYFFISCDIHYKYTTSFLYSYDKSGMKEIINFNNYSDNKNPHPCYIADKWESNSRLKLKIDPKIRKKGKYRSKNLDTTKKEEYKYLIKVNEQWVLSDK
jgi:hypothetical protein